MLGHRGCRLGITYPEITEMQARAIFEARVQVAKKGSRVIPEIMIPLVGSVEELRTRRRSWSAWPNEVFAEGAAGRVEYMVGTMIEVPRAALTADEIAKEAEFFSFGTNDLTQTTFGFSRDDSGKFLRVRRAEDLARRSVRGRSTGGRRRLVQIGVEEGRAARPDLEVGICGEHGGDPARSSSATGRARLCVVLAVPRADRAAGGGPGRGARQGADER